MPQENTQIVHPRRSKHYIIVVANALADLRGKCIKPHADDQLVFGPGLRANILEDRITPRLGTQTFLSYAKLLVRAHTYRHRTSSHMTGRSPGPAIWRARFLPQDNCITN
jgi:hypothetical protein